MIALRKPDLPPAMEEVRPFLAFVKDDATAAIVREAIAGRDAISPEDIVVGALDDAIEGLVNIRTPSLLIVDLGDARDVMVEAERLAQVCDPDADVVLLGAVNDMMLQRELVAAGVADYVVKPFSAEDLARVVDRLTALPVQMKDAPVTVNKADCKAVALIGVRGGVGASTLAANLAWSASHDFSCKTAVVDLDLTFGTLALLMDIDPGNGLADAMREPGRMDELFVKRASTTIDPNLSIIAAETDMARGDIASAQAFKALYDFLAGDNACVVADVPRSLAISQPEFLKVFQRVVLVAEPTLAAMRDTARLATHVGLLVPDAEVLVVLSRCGAAAKEELSKKTFEEGAGVKVNASIPYDLRAALAAEAVGKCVVQSAKKTKLARAISTAATELLGYETERSVGGISRLLGRFSRKKGTEAEDVRKTSDV